MLTRRELVAGLTVAPAIAAPRKRPNVLLVMTDQQTIKAMSCAGNEYVKTPSMDDLASTGVRFEKSYCTSPVCCPARASIVTGRMPHETGVVYSGVVQHGIPNFGELLEKAGYDTAWAGKWHIGDMYPALRQPWTKREPLTRIPGFRVLPMQGDHSLMSIYGDFADGPAADAAIEFLRRKREAPFALGVSLHNPHDICHHIVDKLPPGHPAWQDVRADRATDYPPLPPNFARDPREPEFISLCRSRDHYGPEVSATSNWDEQRWRQYLYVYYRMTERVDREIGRLLQALSETGQDTNTLVIFTCDHGEGTAAHHWAVKLSLYEEVVSVPLILSWKGVIPKGRVDGKHLVSSLDILPTICDYTSVAAPDVVRGESLRGWIERPSSRSREFVVAQLAPDPQRRDLQGRMVRSERYKYVAFSEGGGREMLFDLENDPGEMKNLAGQTGTASVLNRHRALLSEWLRKHEDTFPAVPGRKT